MAGAGDIAWDEPEPSWLHKGAAPVETRPFANNTGPDVAGQLQREAAAAPAAVAANASLPEAIGSGFVQGATLGFSDELEGAGRALKDKIFGAPIPKSYAEYRDQSRAMDAGTRAAHPTAYGAGEVAGGLATAVVPVGAAAKGASLGAKAFGAAKTGAAFGGASAAGYSTADSLPQLAEDTAKGAVLGGAVGVGSTVVGAGLQKLTDKAKVKAAKILRSYFGGGPDVGKTTETIRRKATQGNAADVLETELAHDPEAQQIALVARKDPEKAAGLVQSRVDEITKPREALYESLEKGQGPIDTDKYRAFITDEMKANAGKNTDAARARLGMLQEMLDNADTYWGAAKGNKVSWLEMREHVTGLQSQASSTMGAIAETERKGLADWRKSVGEKFLNGELDQAAKKNPGQTAVVEAIRELNERFHAWKGVGDMLGQRISSKNANAWKEKALGGALPGAIGATEEVTRSIAHGDDPVDVVKHAAMGGAAGFAAGVVAHRVVGPAAQSVARNVPIKVAQGADLAQKIFGQAVIRDAPGHAAGAGAAASAVAPGADDGITWDD